MEEKNEKNEKNEEKVEKIEKKSIQRRLVLIIISAVVLALLGFLIFKTTPNKNVLPIEDARLKAENFINDFLMLPGTTANIDNIEKEYGLYKIMVKVDEEGEPIESFISQDGELFFPQAINIAEYEETLNASKAEVSTVNNKSEKPKIELFVMSHCPYGTQMEKAIIPALELLQDKIDFTLKFNNYAMHDKAELNEQLNQYCIQKEDPKKLLSYLKCFNASEDSAKCLSENKIDSKKITTCVKATDKEYQITKSYEDQSTWLEGLYPIFPIYNADNEKYMVEGSPTLIINEQMVSAERNPNSLLKLICTAFSSAPAECSEELSTITPGYGFGE